jgi:hypothetical protein
MRLLTSLPLLGLALAGCVTGPNTGAAQNLGVPPVLMGSYQPDYLYPWTVKVGNHCRGTLISPRWVLTAAHCIQSTGHRITITRRDPSGVDHNQMQYSASGGITRHIDYVESATPRNDVALIRLAAPFEITSEAQVAGLPPMRRWVGVPGFVASDSDDLQPIPAGQLSVFRAAVPFGPDSDRFEILTTAQSGALCSGDSGSGFVTVENGRAIVRGVASSGAEFCTNPVGKLIMFMDAYHFRGWILQTMGVTDYFLDGNTRIRHSGDLARGVMGITCSNQGDLKAWGPLYVRGTQEGLNCGNDETQTIVCSVDAGQPRLKITRFSMKTSGEDGSVQTQDLPHTDRFAAFSALRPHGAFREFDCRVSSAIIDDDTPEVNPPTEPR